MASHANEKPWISAPANQAWDNSLRSDSMWMKLLLAHHTDDFLLWLNSHTGSSTLPQLVAFKLIGCWIILDVIYSLYNSVSHSPHSLCCNHSVLLVHFLHWSVGFGQQPCWIMSKSTSVRLSIPDTHRQAETKFSGGHNTPSTSKVTLYFCECLSIVFFPWNASVFDVSDTDVFRHTKSSTWIRSFLSQWRCW